VINRQYDKALQIPLSYTDWGSYAQSSTAIYRTWGAMLNLPLPYKLDLEEPKSQSTTATQITKYFRDKHKIINRYKVNLPDKTN